MLSLFASMPKKKKKKKATAPALLFGSTTVLITAVVIMTLRVRRVASFAATTTARKRPFPISTLRSLSRRATSSTSSSDNNNNNNAAVVELAHRLDGLDKPTVWHEFSPLAVEHGAVNLGQGFPDWDPPSFVREAMTRSIDPKFRRHANQYARSYAHLPLAEVLAEDYNRRWAGIVGTGINPATQIATAVGCTNCLYCALQGLLDPGDEAVLFEPFFDVYESQVKMAGGVPVYVPLRPSSSSAATTVVPDGDGGAAGSNNGSSQVFALDLSELENAITDRTKVLLLNTPHNPTGKMFSRRELEGIADIVHKFPNLTVISDEVYEHIVFDEDEEPHVSMASIPGMFDRTLTLSSAGKTFSATGWKVGWAVGPERLVKAVIAVQQWVNFSAPTPNQDAMAQALEMAKQPYEGFPTYYAYLANEYKRKRGILADALSSVGMVPIVPPGGFFIMADTSGIDGPPQSYLDRPTPASPDPMPRDWALSRWLTTEVGVTAIPPSAFYSPPNVPLASNLLRFAFCKGDDTLLEARRRLEKYFLE